MPSPPTTRAQQIYEECFGKGQENGCGAIPIETCTGCLHARSLVGRCLTLAGDGAVGLVASMRQAMAPGSIGRKP